MALGIGIVGLPNVGKSTTFNALTKTQNAEAANYPFCTIEPNKAIVPLPDARIDKLAELVKPEKVINATVEFFDIAGLVKGASLGEGLGNQFLANIRETSAIVHVVRCFEDDNVIHVSGAIDPRDDIEVINTELMLADLQQLEGKIDRLNRQVKGDKKLQPVLDIANELKAMLETGKPVAAHPDRESEAFRALNNEMRFLTGKTVIYAANVDEEHLTEDNDYVRSVRALATEQNAEVVKICAKLEEEMAGLLALNVGSAEALLLHESEVLAPHAQAVGVVFEFIQRNRESVEGKEFGLCLLEALACVIALLLESMNLLLRGSDFEL